MNLFPESVVTTQSGPERKQRLPAPSTPDNTNARDALNTRFGQRISINPHFTRQTVSHQGNRRVPGFRWLRYKEAFSGSLVARLLDRYKPQQVLDPFAGIGTTVLTAAGRGLQATGIEIMPVGILTAHAIAHAANGMTGRNITKAAKHLQQAIASPEPPPAEYEFPHVTITNAAFPSDTERAIAKARQFIASLDDRATKTLLNFACMSILETVSYTRKDGQYLRWDNRSGRKLRGKMNKGPIPSFALALASRIGEITSDLDAIRKAYSGTPPELIAGSSLELLRTLPDESFDLVITSPPYANRYDYTRTYALELAWLGLDQAGFSALRQQMLSATVENRTKLDILRELYSNQPALLDNAIACYKSQRALHEVLAILRAHMHELGNRHVIRLLEGYFLEMTVIVAELSRLLRAGGNVIMVNDNVQYHGQEVPVDFILADVAEQFGLTCRNIWTLARGKGNASQQMGRFGRRELRKCVYRWQKEA